MNYKLVFFFFLLLFLPTMILAQENDLVSYSRKLPCIFIETQNHDSIKSKDDYIPAKYYIETFGHNGYEDIGSSEEQLDMEIRGRGNWTWQAYDKKPYKIKLGGGKSLLGMSKNKHWALLAHADDITGFFRNTVGFEISRMMGMAYTPEQRPVELVINGDYQGLYFLTETIRVGNKRVDIKEQTNGETNAELVSGAWLVEFDNYKDENQISIDISDTYLERFYVTYHSPDSLSDVQHDYLANEWQIIKDALFNHDSKILWEHLDLNTLTKYCMIAEIMSAQEAFTGSYWLHKDAGESKWKSGPVWDFGNSITSYYRDFIWKDNYWGFTIETELSQFNELQEKIREEWPSFYEKAYPHLNDFIETFAEEINEAAKHDFIKWPQYGCSDVKKSSEYVKTCMNSRIDWLNLQWSSIASVENCKQKATSKNQMYLLDGKQIHTVTRDKGILIINGRKVLK